MHASGHIKPSVVLAGIAYGARMSFRRYLKMLVYFTDGRIPMVPATPAQAFITGAYVGYLRANPGCSIR